MDDGKGRAFLAGWYTGAAMAVILVAVCLLFLSQSVCAQERYTDPDKVMHLGAGFVIGAGVTAYTKSATAGALAGCAVGIAKEAYDASQPARHSATEKDAIATCLGAAIGAGGAWAIVPGSTVRLQWRRQF